MNRNQIIAMQAQHTLSGRYNLAGHLEVKYWRGKRGHFFSTEINGVPLSPIKLCFRYPIFESKVIRAMDGHLPQDVIFFHRLLGIMRDQLGDFTYISGWIMTEDIWRVIVEPDQRNSFVKHCKMLGITPIKSRFMDRRPSTIVIEVRESLFGQKVEACR